MEVKSWLLLALSIAVGPARGQCYFPGGDLAKNDQPCHQHAYTSFCCPSGYTCFDNALCIVTADTGIPGLRLGLASRGTCTNPLWNQSACGNFCLSNPVNDNSGALLSCGSGRWCCGPDAGSGGCDCASGQGTFHLDDGKAITIIGYQGPLTQTNTNVVPVASATSRASVTSQTSSSSTTASTSSATATATAAGTSLHRHKQLSGGAIGGIVAGVVGFIILLAAIIACFIIRKKKPAEGQDGATETRSEASSIRRGNLMNSIRQGDRPNPDPYAGASHRQSNYFLNIRQNMMNPNRTGIPDHNVQAKSRPQGMQYPPAYSAYTTSH